MFSVTPIRDIHVSQHHNDAALSYPLWPWPSSGNTLFFSWDSVTYVPCIWHKCVLCLPRRCCVFWTVEPTSTGQMSPEPHLFTLPAGDAITHATVMLLILLQSKVLRWSGRDAVFFQLLLTVSNSYVRMLKQPRTLMTNILTIPQVALHILVPALLQLYWNFCCFVAMAKETQHRSCSLEVPNTSLTRTESLLWISVSRWGVHHLWAFCTFHTFVLLSCHSFYVEVP